MHPKVATLFQCKQYEQRTPEWYEVRKTLLTASDVAAALDVKPYESYKGSPRAELLRRKSQPESGFTGNMFTAHGVKYEDEARVKYEATSGETVHEFGLLLHPELPWLGASPDGVTESGKVVEIKCPISRPIIPGHVPEHYMPQLQMCMEVCDLDEAVFIQYKPAALTWPKPEEFDVCTVARDREWFAHHLQHMRDFWQEMRDLQDDRPATVQCTPTPRRTIKPRALPSCAILDDLYDEEENNACCI